MGYARLRPVILQCEGVAHRVVLADDSAVWATPFALPWEGRMICAKCGSPIPDVEQRFKTKLSPKDRRVLELVAADTCERIGGDALNVAFNYSQMALTIRFTRDFINKVAQLLAEQPEGFARAKVLADELSFLQYSVNETLGKMGAPESERKWHVFLPDSTIGANRE